jgi:glycosyltransferase involved in cell wall biosynthesis
LWVIVRDTDHETWQFLETFDRGSLPLQIATVTEVGVIAAMNIGLESATGDIIVFTDDDAAPHSDWFARIEAYYLADEKIGGVGGSDWVYHGTKLEDGSQPVVGKLQWFGRLIGNHHIGSGEGREVDALNCVKHPRKNENMDNLWVLLIPFLVQS